jgi:hypothetical protein
LTNSGERTGGNCWNILTGKKLLAQSFVGNSAEREVKDLFGAFTFWASRATGARLEKQSAASLL